MKRIVRPKHEVEMVHDLQGCNNIKASWDNDEDWVLLDRKDIRDFDGFMTKYSLYYNPEEESWCTVFGDPDLYRPGYDSDAEFDSEWEAREFFDDYDTDVDLDDEF